MDIISQHFEMVVDILRYHFEVPVTKSNFRISDII